MNQITEDLNYTGQNATDVKRIKAVCFKNGYCVSMKDCEYIWRKHSEYNFASWIALPKNDAEIWKIITEILA